MLPNIKIKIAVILAIYPLAKIHKMILRFGII
jgi:hypothetical protein